MTPRIATFFVFLLAFVASCSPPNRAEAPLPSHVDAKTSSAIAKMTQMTVMILNPRPTPERSAEGEPDRYAICTGTWISATEILTAYHCAIGGSMRPNEGAIHDMLAQQGLVDIKGRHVRFAVHGDVDFSKKDHENINTERDSVIDRFDVESDIAILRATKTTSSVWAQVTARPLEFGERVRVVSHSATLGYAYSEGYVSHPHRAYSLDYATGDTSIVQIASDILDGSSGGGVFDSDGQLVAVIVATLGPSGDLMIAIHHENVRRLIRSRYLTR